MSDGDEEVGTASEEERSLADSNVVPVSNTAPRVPGVQITADHRFRTLVRGRGAVQKLLGYCGEVPSTARYEDSNVQSLCLRGVITEEQRQALRDDLVCVVCRRIPTGRPFPGGAAFRCDHPECPDRTPKRRP